MIDRKPCEFENRFIWRLVLPGASLSEQPHYLPADVFECLEGHRASSNKNLKSYSTLYAAMAAYRSAAFKAREQEAVRIIRKIDSLLPKWTSHFPDEESEVSIPRRELMVLVQILKPQMPEVLE